MMVPGKSTLRRGGFTLIELLIVVAIIAILAGIAVVNFLQAQTNAKVARAKSDLRTVVSGIELYRVDNGRYPTYHYTKNESAEDKYSFHLGGEMSGIFNSPPFDGRNPITTPIAYLSAMPLDVFSQQGTDEALETRQFWYVNWDYAIPRVSGGFNMIFQSLRNEQGSFRVHSSGPDHRGPDTDVGQGTVIYDASNGTISRGDVVRTQKQQL